MNKKSMGWLIDLIWTPLIFSCGAHIDEHAPIAQLTHHTLCYAGVLLSDILQVVKLYFSLKTPDDGALNGVVVRV